jgi:hypothetical protein
VDKKKKSDRIILHLLHLSLVYIRNMAYGKRRVRNLVQDWAEMIHNTPSLLQGTEFNENALRWFSDVQVRRFIEDYPIKEDGAYQQILPLFEELKALLQPLPRPSAHEADASGETE